jgi:2-C-methyl-D-erythritol 2,4-cyclodiphosphate synthase
MNRFRVGFGYDVHQLVTGSALIIGGVSIDFHKGALGHSDADVLLHAIADALLGAAGLDDIGVHFPDTDPSNKDISSLLILKKVHDLIAKKGYKVNNVDTTIVLQEPKINKYVSVIKKEIASILHIDTGDISVKATTTEQLGHIGSGNGIAAYAIVSIIS